MTPVRAFLMLVAVAVVVPLTILATRPEAAPTKPSVPATPDFSLTDAEAIAEFEHLNEIRITAYKTRDVTLLGETLTAASPLLRRGENEIRRLLRDRVIIESKFITRDVQVISNSPHAVTVRQIEVELPKYVSEEGSDVTGDARAQERTIEWTLHLEGSQWKLHDSRLISSGRARY